jgi:uncharacterized protein (DUF1684 family)
LGAATTIPAQTTSGIARLFRIPERLGSGQEAEYTRSEVVATFMNSQALLRDRKDKDEFFGQSPQSPLAEHDQARFAGLAYFDPNPDLVFTVQPVPVESTEVAIETTTGDFRTYRRVATASFAIDQTDLTLALYSSGHDTLFLPFRDATSGKETYGSGRYVDIVPNEDGSITIDFNYAYAPYCSYSDAYSCAIPPAENWMSVTIDAGERNEH